MSTTISTLLQGAENIQSELVGVFQKDIPRENLPFLEFVGNNTPLNQTVNPGQGKTRTVNLRYTPDIAESDVDSNQENPGCTATTERGDKIATYEIDVNENLQVEELIQVKKLKDIQRDNPAYFAERLNHLIYALDRKVATKTATELALLNGKWAADVVGVTSDRLVVNTLKSGSSDINPLAIADIDLALQQTGLTGGAAIFGGVTLHKYMRAILAGCCANQGINVQEILALYGKACMYDRRVATALGGNDYNVAITPTSLALLQYTVNEWSAGAPRPIIEGSGYFHTVVTSPRTGINMDLNVKDDCGNIHMVLTATTKLVNMPDDMFPSGDNWDGVNWVNEIKVTNS